jgi:hypothetical protein
MSYELTDELHKALNAGRLSMLKQTERSVLFWMCETCRHNSRVVSISEPELQRLIGLSRDPISTAIKALIGYQIIRRNSHGNQYRSATYELLPLLTACTADQTSTDNAACTADQTSTDSACTADQTSTYGELVKITGPLVRIPDPLVRKNDSACTASTTHPGVPRVTNPEVVNPERDTRGHVREDDLPQRDAETFNIIFAYYKRTPKKVMVLDLMNFLQRTDRPIRTVNDLTREELAQVIKAIHLNRQRGITEMPWHGFDPNPEPKGKTQ